jgi:mRNA-degrading endonuclease toxin of MazEF toxin-antitoxin module
MKRGEVWRVAIPAAPGHSQTGERPAIIVQELVFNNSLPTTLIVPLTSKLAAARFAGTLAIQPDQHNGLTAPSVALVFQMRTPDQRNCLKPLGILDAATPDQIFALLDQLTGR